VETVVRDADPARDFESVAALLTLHGAEPVEAWELLEEHARVVPGKLLRRFVAERGGTVVGVATCIRFPSQPAGLYHVHVLAEPGGIGVGSALAARLEELLAGEPVAELWVDVREDRPRGLQFAEQHGFNERALRALYEINRVAALDDPSSAGGFPPYETWLGIVPQSSGFDAEGQILAEAGGRFVGLAAVGHSGEQAWNAITGGAPEFRGRGIGGALKVRAAEYAQAAGAGRLETETNAENAAMRAINRSLGYEERPGYLTLSRSTS